MKTSMQTSFLLLLVVQLCFTQGSWRKDGDIPENRYFHTVDGLAGKIYLVGGLNTQLSAAPKTVLVYSY